MFSFWSEIVMNSYCGKRREHLFTYKSWVNESQIDYMLCRRHDELRMKD